MCVYLCYVCPIFKETDSHALLKLTFLTLLRGELSYTETRKSISPVDMEFNADPRSPKVVSEFPTVLK